MIAEPTADRKFGEQKTVERRYSDPVVNWACKLIRALLSDPVFHMQISGQVQENASPQRHVRSPGMPDRRFPWPLCACRGKVPQRPAPQMILTTCQSEGAFFHVIILIFPPLQVLDYCHIETTFIPPEHALFVEDLRRGGREPRDATPPR